jgi:nitroreductase
MSKPSRAANAANRQARGPAASARRPRRTFLKESVLLGGASLLAGASAPLSAEPPAPAAAPSTTPPNDTLKTLESLRTIHGNFLDKAVPEDALRQILEASVRAANASNMQSYSIVVVKDPQKIQQVCTYRGPCMLLYCVDFNRLEASAASLGHSYHPDTIVEFVTASINTTLAAQTAVIAARSLGIDSLITNGIHRGDMERVWTLLGLPPKHCFPLIAVVLGYPTTEPDHRKGRLEGPGVIHADTYRMPTKEQVDEITRLYDDEQRNVALNYDWKAQGHKHYLDWFFTVWVGRQGKPTGQETQMLRLLKRSGFVEPQGA